MTTPEQALHANNSLDQVIWRSDLQARLQISSNTVRRWMLAGKLPDPDINLSRRTKGWKLSTLINAGINV